MIARFEIEIENRIFVGVILLYFRWICIHARSVLKKNVLKTRVYFANVLELALADSMNVGKCVKIQLPVSAHCKTEINDSINN
jgi:hypothetical protein